MRAALLVLQQIRNQQRMTGSEAVIFINAAISHATAFGKVAP
jgi:hypothetical protein